MEALVEPGTGVAKHPETYYEDYVRSEWKLLCRLRLEAPERSISDLAAALGFSYGTVRLWLRHPAYQRYENFVVSELRLPVATRPSLPSERFRSATVPERFQEYEQTMQEHLLDIIETSNNEKLRAELATRWLEFAGHSTNRNAPAPTSLSISDSRLLIFVERAREAGLGFALPSIGATLEASIHQEEKS